MIQFSIAIASNSFPSYGMGCAYHGAPHSTTVHVPGMAVHQAGCTSGGKLCCAHIFMYWVVCSIFVTMFICCPQLLGTTHPHHQNLHCACLGRLCTRMHSPDTMFPLLTYHMSSNDFQVSLQSAHAVHQYRTRDTRHQDMLLSE